MDFTSRSSLCLSLLRLRISLERETKYNERWSRGTVIGNKRVCARLRVCLTVYGFRHPSLHLNCNTLKRKLKDIEVRHSKDRNGFVRNSMVICSTNLGQFKLIDRKF